MAKSIGILSNGVLRETADAWLLSFGQDDERWLPKEIARPVNYSKGYFEAEGWFAKRAMAQHMAKVSRKALPTEQLMQMLQIDTGYQVDQASSRPHQVQAYEKACKLRASALFMACRSGKTKVAIDVATTHLRDGRIDHVLWLCPVSVIPTAQWQWSRFAPGIDSVTFFGLETLSGCRHSRYGALLTMMRAKRCMLVVDESHMVKNTQSRRAKRTAELASMASVKMLMTGTPVTRNIEDLYQQFCVLDRRILGYHNRFAFSKAHLIYSDKYPGLVKRTQDVHYLTARMEPFVYEFFPPEDAGDSWDSVTTSLTPNQRHWYDAVKEAVLWRISQYDRATSDIYVLFTALQSIVSGHISSRVLNRALGTKGQHPQGITFATNKLDAMLEQRAEVDGQVVVWCSRLHEVSTICAAIPSAYVVTGHQSPQDRHSAVQAFRANPSATLVATTQVARRGIDLYEADTAMFYGHSFDWEAREQAAARIKAPGIKDRPCTFVDFVSSHSLDERVIESYVRKANIVGQFVAMLRKDKEAALKALATL